HLGFCESNPPALAASLVGNPLPPFLIEKKPVARRGAPPVVLETAILQGLAEYRAQPAAGQLRPAPARAGLRVAAPAVVLGCFHQARPHRIHVDEGRNPEQRPYEVLDQDTLVASLPERSGTVEAFVHVEGHAQLQLFEEEGEVAAPP